MFSISRISLIPLISLVSLVSVAGCADRTTGSADDTADETAGPEPGEPFAGCMDKNECLDEWCLHPTNEPGFCTYACNGGAASCEPITGGTATPTCLPVDVDEVCALDCSNGKSCPPSMRCEQIEADNQARSICF